MKKGTIFLLGNVIENTDEKIQNCIRYLGVAPESVFLKRHRITLGYYYGEKKNFYIDLAFLPLQNLALECIAPLDGDDNDYRHYLELYGTSGTMTCGIRKFSTGISMK